MGRLNLFGRKILVASKPKISAAGAIVRGSNGIQRVTFRTSAHPGVKVTIGGKNITAETIKKVDSRIVRRPKN